MIKRFLVFSFLLAWSGLSQAQYYYKDIISNKQAKADMLKYKDNNVRNIKIKSFEDDGAASEGFYCEKKIGKDYLTTELFTKTNMSPVSLVSSIYNTDGQLLSSVDSSDISTTRSHLSAEYVSGRRASYLNPIKMYIFTSAAFFLFAFTAFTIEPDGDDIDLTVEGRSLTELREMDSLSFEKFSRDHPDQSRPNRQSFNAYLDSIESGMHFFERAYRSKDQYDSLLRSGEVKDGWLKRQWVYREIEANRKYGSNRKQVWADFFNKLVHAFPQLLFISLPLFALVLKLLYIRQKRFYYAAHIIFSVNLYIFAFMVMLLILGIAKLEESFAINWLGIVKLFLIATIFLYEYKSMRRFYGQNRFKTLVKFIIVNVCHIAIIVTLVIIGALVSLMNI